jgi:hypothetical protein
MANPTGRGGFKKAKSGDSGGRPRQRNNMPALKNPRHEAFAQGLARGMSASAAYVEAGYKAAPRMHWAEGFKID